MLCTFFLALRLAPVQASDSALAAFALAALMFLAVGSAAIATWVAVVHDRFVLISFVSTLVLTLGASFVPVDSLPHGLEAVARLNPFTYDIDGVRAPLLGDSTLLRSLHELGVIAALCCAVWLAAWALTRRNVDLSQVSRNL